MTNILNNTNNARRLVGVDVIYPEFSYRIMEAVFEVQNQLGPGFGEEISQQALIAEMEARSIPFEAQKSFMVRYKGKPVGTYRLDLLVAGKIILELKALPV
jgi:GxxExxY protein